MVEETVEFCIDDEANKQLSKSEEEKPYSCVSPSPNLAEGIIKLYKNGLDEEHKKIQEVIKNQNVLRDFAQNEIVQLRENPILSDIILTFENVKIYHKKLVTMKKEMNSLTSRIDKVKLNARRLQVQREKEELEAAQAKERQRKYEKELTAKPATDQSQSLSNV